MDVEDLEVGQQRLLDQRAEGAEDEHVRAGGGQPLARLGGVDRLGLEEVEAERARGLGDRRRREPAPAPRGAIGAGDDERGAVVGGREALQDGGGEVRGAQEGGGQAASRRSRRIRMASLR
jgi:hypothetical protein